MTALLTTCEIFYLFFLGYMHRGVFIFILDDSIYSNNRVENTESYYPSTGKKTNKKTPQQNEPYPKPKTPRCLQLRTEGTWTLESETQNLSFGLTFG